MNAQVVEMGGKMLEAPGDLISSYLEYYLEYYLQYIFFLPGISPSSYLEYYLEYYLLSPSCLEYYLLSPKNRYGKSFS